jgi:hypothetical protein
MKIGQPKLSETFRKKSQSGGMFVTPMKCQGSFHSGLLISEVMGEAPNSAFGSWVT